MILTIRQSNSMGKKVFSTNGAGTTGYSYRTKGEPSSRFTESEKSIGEGSRGYVGNWISKFLEENHRRVSSWLLFRESLLGRTQKACMTPPPKKKNTKQTQQPINWTSSILKTSAHYGGYKAPWVSQNPQNYVKQAVNIHVWKTDQRQPECQGSWDGMQTDHWLTVSQMCDINPLREMGKRSWPQGSGKWCLDQKQAGDTGKCTHRVLCW